MMGVFANKIPIEKEIKEKIVLSLIFPQTFSLNLPCPYLALCLFTRHKFLDRIVFFFNSFSIDVVGNAL